MSSEQRTVIEAALLTLGKFSQDQVFSPQDVFAKMEELNYIHLSPPERLKSASELVIRQWRKKYPNSVSQQIRSKILVPFCEAGSRFIGENRTIKWTTPAFEHTGDKVKYSKSVKFTLINKDILDRLIQVIVHKIYDVVNDVIILESGWYGSALKTSALKQAARQRLTKCAFWLPKTEEKTVDDIIKDMEHLDGDVADSFALDTVLWLVSLGYDVHGLKLDDITRAFDEASSVVELIDAQKKRPEPSVDDDFHDSEDDSENHSESDGGNDTGDDSDFESDGDVNEGISKLKQRIIDGELRMDRRAMKMLDTIVADLSLRYHQVSEERCLDMIEREPLIGHISRTKTRDKRVLKRAIKPKRMPDRIKQLKEIRKIAGKNDNLFRQVISNEDLYPGLHQSIQWFRVYHRHGKVKAEYVAQLKDLGISLEENPRAEKRKSDFARAVTVLEKFKEKYGHLDIYKPPKEEVDEDVFSVTKKLRSTWSLDDAETRLLVDMGFVFDSKVKRREEIYVLLQEFYKLGIEERFLPQYREIRRMHDRYLYRVLNNLADDEEKSRLFEIGLKLDMPVYRDMLWESMFKRYLAAQQRNESLGKGLSDWCYVQRRKFNEGRLEAKRVQKLKEIGFDWDMKKSPSYWNSLENLRKEIEDFITEYKLEPQVIPRDSDLKEKKRWDLLNAIRKDKHGGFESVAMKLGYYYYPGKQFGKYDDFERFKADVLDYIREKGLDESVMPRSELFKNDRPMLHWAISNKYDGIEAAAKKLGLRYVTPNRIQNFRGRLPYSKTERPASKYYELEYMRQKVHDVIQEFLLDPSTMPDPKFFHQKFPPDDPENDLFYKSIKNRYITYQELAHKLQLKHPRDGALLVERKPANYWSNLDNVKMEIDAIIDQKGLPAGVVPFMSDLDSKVRRAIRKHYHSRKNIAKILGYQCPMGRKSRKLNHDVRGNKRNRKNVASDDKRLDNSSEQEESRSDEDGLCVESGSASRPLKKRIRAKKKD